MTGGTRIKGIQRASRPGEPLVSVITVVRNGEKHIGETIRSVTEQSYRNIEYIVVDGASADGTVQILENYNDKIDYWVSEPDKGIYDAMNKGIALAKGEIIGILNADDYYLPGAIEKVVQADKQSGAGLFYGDMLHLGPRDPNGTRLKPDIKKMNEMPAIYHPTCFVKKSVYERIGTFDTRFKISSDYEFLLRCIRKDVKFCYVDEILTAFRAGGMSASCASNIEGYKIMKMHRTGHHRAVIWRGIRCYAKTFLKKILFLKEPA